MTSFEDLFAPYLGGNPKGAVPPTEKGVQLRGKLIDDVYYIRAEDVAALLDINHVLPKAAVKLRNAGK